MLKLLIIKFLLLITFVSLIEGVLRDKSRIVNGKQVGYFDQIRHQVVNPGRFPYVVHLKKIERYLDFTTSSFGCTGSIIRSNAILTAAHCVYETYPDDITVYAGIVNKFTPESTAQILRAHSYFVHPHYSNYYKPNAHDIAVIILNGYLNPTQHVNVINLPNPNDFCKNYKADLNVTAMGWGADENGDNPDWLQYTNLTLISHSECQKMGTSAYSEVYISGDMMCVFDRKEVSTTCLGDSGGPIVHNNTQLGVVIATLSARDIDRTNKTTCDANYPSISVVVSNYVNWIHSILEHFPL